MTKITMDVSEEEYIAWKKEWGRENSCNHSFQLGSRIVDAYEAEQNKIGPGDWYKTNDRGDDNGIYKLTQDCLVGDNTKLSPEAQDILNKETGIGEDRHLNMCNIHDFKISQGGTCHICDLKHKDIVQGEG